MSIPLEFTPYGSNQSAIFDPEMQALLSKPISYHHHTAGMPPDVFAEDPAIGDMFEITSINHDREGKPFVSSFEARDFDTYPIWGVSFGLLMCHLLSVVARWCLHPLTLSVPQYAPHYVLYLIVPVAP